MKVNNTHLHIEPIQGQCTGCLENIASSNAHIGSVSVQNATDVTFGNKSFFNGPMVIKQLTVDYGSQNSDTSKSGKTNGIKQKNRLKITTTPMSFFAESKESCSRRILRSFRNHPVLACAILTAFVLIIGGMCVSVGYVLYVYGKSRVLDIYLVLDRLIKRME